jgi:hypothetical protein
MGKAAAADDVSVNALLTGAMRGLRRMMGITLARRNVLS